MNAQEIFDTVVRHLHAQGRPALDSLGDCRYRTVDGLKCAVGGLIPDGVDPWGIEGFPVTSDTFSKWAAIHELPDLPENVGLLKDLQSGHDHGFVGSDMGKNLAAVAQTHALSSAVPDGLDWSHWNPDAP